MKNLYHDFFLRSSEENAKSLPCFGAALFLPWDAIKAGNGPAHLRWCDIVLLHPPEGVCNSTMGIFNSHKNHLPSANTFTLQKAQDYQIFHYTRCITPKRVTSLWGPPASYFFVK